MSEITAGFLLMGYGLAGVFTALIIFYGVLRLLTLIFRERDKKAE